MLMITRVALSTILSLLTFIFYFVINIIRKCIRHTKNPNWIILSLGIKISIKKKLKQLKMKQNLIEKPFNKNLFLSIDKNNRHFTPH